MKANKTLRLESYKRPAFTTDHVKLDIHIEENRVRVESEVTYRRTKKNNNVDIRGTIRAKKKEDVDPLILNAKNPNKNLKFLQSLTLNGQALNKVINLRDSEELVLPVFPSENEVTVNATTYLDPEANTRLLGLYQSDECYVTQCESEGFRSITPFLDRPDVMATYDVTVHADGEKFPVLLANGHKVESGQDEDGTHYARFEDPLPKPSYLFALAAGNFDYIEDKHVTPSGHEVNLRVYTEPGKENRAQHAMWALKKSMEFDEKVFDREYELDDFSIVTVSKFTYGAMENTSLNVFRDSLILASPETATDANYQRITDVVGHEYFHHWSGNLVTLANWFNLSLKEGLTVLREQMFTASVTSDDWERVRSVQDLRKRQFLEDDSPMAMPVMPPELQALNNIYNGTTYDKGAEVLRMMKTLMGEDTFLEGVKDYFDSYKGQSVTIEDFIEKMEQASGLDLSGQFKLWYTQSGRPRVKATIDESWDNDSKTYTLTLEQDVPPTRDQEEKEPQYIPVKVALVDRDGNDMPLVLAGDNYDTEGRGDTERVLHFTGKKQTFVFKDLEKPPVFHSLFRDFSAPVTFDSGLSTEQMQLQAEMDNNAFTRWDAVQQLTLNEMKRLYEAHKDTGETPAVSEDLLETYRTVLSDTNRHPALTAQIMTMPTVAEFESAVSPADPSTVAAVMTQLRETVGKELYNDFKTAFDRQVTAGPYSSDYDSAGARALKGIAVSYMLANGGEHNINTAAHLYENADNMTDRMIYMQAVNDIPGKKRDTVMQDFYDKFKDDSLVIQKWFFMQSSMNSEKVFENIDKIVDSDVFNWENPGHAQSLFGGLIRNYEQFHRADGKGYEYLADMIIKLDKVNGATASRFASKLADWRDYEGENSRLMVGQLERLAETEGLSTDVREIVSKALPTDTKPANDNAEEKDGPDASASPGPAPQ